MQSPSKDTKKPKLTRKILERESIYFYEDVHKRNSLPKWLRPIHLGMRFMRTKVPEESREDFVAELKEFQRSGQDRAIASASHWSLKPSSIRDEYLHKKSFDEKKLAAETREVLVTCRKVQERAIYLCGTNEKESAWAEFLGANFFKTYREVHGTPDEHSYLFDRWELHADVHWNERLPRNDFGRRVRTGPKPDLTYSFPVIDPSHKISRSHRFDPKVENFTLPVLSELQKAAECSLISSPTSALSKWDPKNPKPIGAADLTCFPWAVVEVKTSKWKRDKSVFCYCQAANASAEALMMRERLSERVNEPSKDALVIFSFTCVGPSVRFWLTFRHPTSRNIEMRCIWATSLELTWGVFALRAVIENMRKWVHNWVKPEICRWITQVRLHPKPSTFLAPDGHQIEQRRRAKSLEPPNQRTSDIPSTSRKPPRSKIIPHLARENTVPRRTCSPSSLSQRLDRLSIRIEDSERDVSDESGSDWQRYASSSDDGSYVASDDASGDDDGFTTVEEETYDTSEDENEFDEGYSSEGS